MPLRAVDWAEFDHNYKNSFCYFKGVPTKILGMDGNQKAYIRIFKDLKIEPYKDPKFIVAEEVISMDTFFREADPVVPTYGFMPTKRDKRVTYVALIPARQWIQSFHRQRLDITKFDMTGYPQGHAGLEQYEENVLPFMLMEDMSVPLVKALEDIYDGKYTGIPLSKQYALMSTVNNDKALLFRKTKAIGTVSELGTLSLYEKEYENYSDLYRFPFARITVGGK